VVLQIKPIQNYRDNWSRSTLRHQQSKLAHGIALNILANQSVKLCHAENGQPVYHALAGGTMPALSISHSRNWVMVGINHDGCIGVDVEITRPCPNALEIAQSMFSFNEATKISINPQSFWGLWVIREAIAKMDGKGLIGALQVDPSLILEVIDKGDIDLDFGRLQVSYRTTGQYHYAVAVRFNAAEQLHNLDKINRYPFKLAEIVNFLYQCE